MKYKMKLLIGFLCCMFLGILAACGTSSVTNTEEIKEDILTAVPSQKPDDLPNASSSIAPEQESMVIDVSAETQKMTGSEESSTASLGGKWPRNEFTNYLPELKAGKISMSLTQGRSFELLASDVSLEEASEYIDAVIENGFSLDASRMDYTESGIEAYTYSANNKEGYHVDLSYSVGLLSISVEK